MTVPDSGIDVLLGKADKPQEFKISHDKLDQATTTKIPKFNFEGKINSVNCCFSDPFEGNLIIRVSLLYGTRKASLM